MSEQVSTTTTPTTDDPVVAALRATMLRGKVTISQIAAAHDVSERAVYNWIDRYHVPFETVPGIGRIVDPQALRKALVKDQNTAPRGRGRPRKAAA